MLVRTLATVAELLLRLAVFASANITLALVQPMTSRPVCPVMLEYFVLARIGWASMPVLFGSSMVHHAEIFTTIDKLVTELRDCPLLMADVKVLLA